MDLGELPGYRFAIAGQYDVRYGEMGFAGARARHATMQPYVARILALLDLPAEGRLLDVGCGSGLLALAAARAQPGLRVAGLDASPGALGVAQALAAEAGVDRVGFVEGDAEAPPAGPWDRIGVLSVFNLLPDKRAALAAWRAVLAPGGRLVIADAFAESGEAARGVGALTEAAFRKALPQAGLRPVAREDLTGLVAEMHAAGAWLWPEYVRPGFRYVAVAAKPTPRAP